VAAGAALNFILRRVRDHGSTLAFIIGAVALVTGVASAIGVDIILSAMALGVTLANLARRRSREAFDLVQQFSSPIYVLFFVIAGAELNVHVMSPWMWILAAPYLVGRVGAKILGANLGAFWVKAPAIIRKYLGLCLFCQGGVAVGLAIVARDRFPGPIGNAIMMIVTATTIVVELIGPSCVKWAAKKAGEIGLNVTEEDLMQSYKVSDMVDRGSPSFTENTTLTNILHTIAETDAMSYPVVDDERKLRGIISLQELKRTFSGEGLSDWLVAFDLMDPVMETVTEDTPLTEAVARMREERLEYLPVVSAENHMRLVGLLELRTVDRQLSQEVLRRRKLAETT
jgi:CBS domain-containing protein